jgi:hypothetical protein
MLGFLMRQVVVRNGATRESSTLLCGIFVNDELADLKSLVSHYILTVLVLVIIDSIFE